MKNWLQNWLMENSPHLQIKPDYYKLYLKDYKKVSDSVKEHFGVEAAEALTKAQFTKAVRKEYKDIHIKTANTNGSYKQILVCLDLLKDEDGNGIFSKRIFTPLLRYRTDKAGVIIERKVYETYESLKEDYKNSQYYNIKKAAVGYIKKANKSYSKPSQVKSAYGYKWKFNI